jgi:DNA invertase Pin-like site-specific DNA recombinase/peptidoglycan hydrolase-like protein with peptidoglycan-binding domain
MTIIRLAALGDRTRSSALLGGLVALAVLVAATAAAPADAATTTTTTTTTPTRQSVQVLAQGAGMGADPSAAVRRTQQALADQGYALGAPGIDGRYGPLTAAAVRRLQADYGLSVDGVVGAKTRRLLDLATQSPRTPGTGTPATPATPARPQQPTTARTATAGDDNSSSWLAAGLAGAALGALLATLAAVTLARRRKQPHPEPAAPLVPIDREVYVEGRSDDERVGPFRGHALAAALTGPPTQTTTDYLVDDPRKPAPVWVHATDVRRSPSRLTAGEPVIGYVTVAADAHHPETDDATHAIEEACQQAGWELAELVTDRETGRSLERPGLGYALEQIAGGNARGLVVSDLRPLARSIVDLGTLMEWFRDARAALVALDLQLDTSTPTGDELATTLITLSDWGRERIANRTRSGLAEIRASGHTTGRPAVSDQPGLAERINAMRSAKLTLQAIADRLNAEGVPTMRGGSKWRPSSVQAALGYRRPSARTPRDHLPPIQQRDEP